MSTHPVTHLVTTRWSVARDENQPKSVGLLFYSYASFQRSLQGYYRSVAEPFQNGTVNCSRKAHGSADDYEVREGVGLSDISFW